ncbi:GGDEF domain-containing protein, partial [Leptospira interrogans]|nr:GGDEF domain-containing protein [Leptospira interrogans]
KKGRIRVSFIEPIRYFPREYPGTTAAS